MDFAKILEQLQDAGLEAEGGTLNNGLAQIRVRVLGITFFLVPDHFPGYREPEEDFLCLRTFLPMPGIDPRHKDFLEASFNRIASNIRMVKIYTVENEGALYAFFEIQMLTSPEAFIQHLPRYAAECVRAIQQVGEHVNRHPSLAG